MKGKQKLNARQVAELFSGLEKADGTAEEKTRSGAVVRPYKLGQDDLSVLGDLHGLRAINERFCRRARATFFPMLQVQPRISAFPPAIKRFDDYADQLENFVSLTTSEAVELRGSTLTVMTPAFVSLLTQTFFGGRLAQAARPRDEFTLAERRVIQTVCDGLNAALGEAWSETLPVRFAQQSQEDNLQFASFVGSSEVVVICSFMVQLPETASAEFDLLYPLETLKPVLAQLRARTQSEQVRSDAAWRARLEQAVLSVPLPMTARLADADVALHTLRAARAGQAEPVPVVPRPRLYVGARPLCEVEIGRASAQAAVRVTRALPDHAQRKETA